MPSNGSRRSPRKKANAQPPKGTRPTVAKAPSKPSPAAANSGTSSPSMALDVPPSEGRQIESGQLNPLIAPANVQKVGFNQPSILVTQANGQQTESSQPNVASANAQGADSSQVNTLASSANGNGFAPPVSPSQIYGSQLPDQFHQTQLAQATYNNQQNWGYQPSGYTPVQHGYGGPPGYAPYLGYHANMYGTSHGYPPLPGQHAGHGTRPIASNQTAVVLSSPQALATLQPQTNRTRSNHTTAPIPPPTAAFGIDPAKLAIAPRYPVSPAPSLTPSPSVAPSSTVASSAPSLSHPPLDAGGAAVAPIPTPLSVPLSAPAVPAEPAHPSQASNADALDDVSHSGSADEDEGESGEEGDPGQSKKRCRTSSKGKGKGKQAIGRAQYQAKNTRPWKTEEFKAAIRAKGMDPDKPPSANNPWCDHMDGVGCRDHNPRMYHRKFMEDPFLDQAHCTKTYKRWLIDILTKAETLGKRTGCWLYLAVLHPESSSPFYHYTSLKLRREAPDAVQEMHSLMTDTMRTLMHAHKQEKMTLAKEVSQLKVELQQAQEKAAELEGRAAAL